MAAIESRILHILDVTTPGDSLGVLAACMAESHRDGTDHRATHRIAALGHRSTASLAALAKIPADSLTFLSSLGWADPTGWRAIGRLIEKLRPTELHAWGVPALFAMSAAGANWPLPRKLTQSVLPETADLQLLGLIRRGHGPAIPSRLALLPFRMIRLSRGQLTIQATSSWLAEKLESLGFGPIERVTMPPGGSGGTVQDAEQLRKELGIAPGNGPLILLGGEGPRARHDLGLWAAAILQQIFPRARAIVREDPRGAADAGLERFWNALPREDLIVPAPGNISWPRLVRAADLMLISADGPIGLGSILAAKEAGIPVILPPLECLAEVLEGANGAITQTAASTRPRALAAAVEAFLTRTGRAVAKVSEVREGCVT